MARPINTKKDRLPIMEVEYTKIVEITKKNKSMKSVTKKKLLIDVVRPLPKPITKVETKKTKEKVIVKKKRIDGIILGVPLGFLTFVLIY